MYTYFSAGKLHFTPLNPSVHVPDIQQNPPAVLDAGELSREDHAADGPLGAPQVYGGFTNIVKPFRKPTCADVFLLVHWLNLLHVAIIISNMPF